MSSQSATESLAGSPLTLSVSTPSPVGTATTAASTQVSLEADVSPQVAKELKECCSLLALLRKLYSAVKGVGG